jgi:glycosyltransferase involved in cell wall biosynthesis
MASPGIIFVNRFFYPDHSATAQILADLCFALSRDGWDVRVVTSRSLYDDTSIELPATEHVNGVRIDRIWTTRFGRKSLAGRAMDYLSFYPAALWVLLRIIRGGDIVIAKTDPPLISVVVGLAAKLRGARHINWLQDLYPEVAAELGMRALSGASGRALRIFRNISLRNARANVVIGDRMAERLGAQGVAPHEITVIHNWSDDELVTPLDRGQCELRREWGFEDDAFVVGYSGNLGRAHEVETLLGAAGRLRHDPRIRFLFVGGGHHGDGLAGRVAAEGLSNFMFRPYQPKHMLAQSLAVPDVHWLSLRPELEGLIVPSKFYGIAAAGRPVLSVTDPDGEIARLVRLHDCGMVVSPGNDEDLARAIMELAGNPSLCRQMGASARAMLLANYTRQASIARWSELLRVMSD